MKKSLETLLTGLYATTFFTGANLAYANGSEYNSNTLYLTGIGLFTTGIFGLGRKYVTGNGD